MQLFNSHGAISYFKFNSYCWVSISAFASLVWVIGLKVFAFTALIKKY